ncbi:MAG TPA: NADH-quinone oxidoreductase subunit J, partial [Thermoanaerobaculia bacterium]|nr:NADH-quinone oxidoreductase subunit J [Thermoanaerobaculia bacterium]
MTGAETVPGALLTGGAGLAFVIFAVLALATAVAVVVARNPIHSALFLLSSFLLVACIFFLQQAEFVGAVQILV